jgi:4'-phosphopantetheinyl transferase EntD
MDELIDSRLRTAIEDLQLPRILIGHRIISVGDESALMPPEVPAFERSVVAVRRASGAARVVARELLAHVGLPGRALPKASSGAPIWPAGIVGSLSHDRSIAVAAVALNRDYRALGIDIEPGEPLPCDLIEIVATPQERETIGDDALRMRLLFAAKEAVYKAVYPLDQTFLDYHDVQVDFARCQATSRFGQRVDLRFCVSTHIVVVAFQKGHDG